MVHFEDFDVPFGIETRRRLAYQMREQGDAERRVAGLEQRDILRGIGDPEMMPRRGPRGADDDRFLRGGAGIEGRLGSPWGGTIDKNVGTGREQIGRG